jgi:O-antigen/teichoic acid export membrane protein
METLSQKEPNKIMPSQSGFAKQLPRPARNVMSNWGGSLAYLFVAFFLSPFVVHHLGVSRYGVWVLIVSFTGYLGLLDLGVRGTVTYYVAKFHTQANHENASRLASTAFVIFLILAFFVFAISVIVGIVFSLWFHVQIYLNTNLQALLMLAGASIGCTLIGGVFGSVLSGLQRLDVVNAIEIGSTILKALLIVVCLEQGKGLIALATIQLISSVLVGLTYAWMSWRLYPQLNVRFVLPDRTNVSLIASFGGYLFLLNVSTYIIMYTDSVVIGAVLSVAMVAFFAIASNLITYSRGFITGVCYSISPWASSLDAQGNREKIELLVLAVPRFATILVLPVILTFVIRGKTFIGLWMGAQFAVPSGKVLQILSLALFFSAANQVATSITIGINRHRPVVFMNIAEAALNLTLSVILAYQIGIDGVAWGTAIASLISSLIFWPLYFRRIFGIRSSQYLISTWARPAVVVIPFALVSYVIDRTWYPPTLFLFFIQVAIALPVAILAFWFGCLSSTERGSCMGRVFSLTVRADELA